MKFYVEVAFCTDGDFDFDDDSRWYKDCELNCTRFCLDKSGDKYDYRLKAIIENGDDWRCKDDVKSLLAKTLCNVRFCHTHLFVMSDMLAMFNEAIYAIKSGYFFKDLSGNYEGTYIFFEEEHLWEEDYSAIIHKDVCECCGQEIPSPGQKAGCYLWI